MVPRCELISYLLRRPPRAPVLVAASYRRGQAERALVSAIERGLREPDERIELRPLARVDAQALVGGGETARFARLYDASGGNPFYLLELARMGSGPARWPDPRRARGSRGRRRGDGRGARGPVERRAQPGRGRGGGGRPVRARPGGRLGRDGGAGRAGRARRADRSRPGSPDARAAQVPLPPSAGAARGLRVVLGREPDRGSWAQREGARGSRRAGGGARAPRGALLPAGRRGRASPSSARPARPRRGGRPRVPRAGSGRR